MLAATDLSPSPVSSPVAPALPTWPQTGCDWLLALGPVRFSAIVSLLVCVASVALTMGVESALDMPQPYFEIGLYIAAAMPLLVSPPIAWYVAKLTVDLDAARAAAEWLAHTDGLTGTLNRRRFWQLGTIEFERALRTHESLSALMIDIDDFKPINDEHGHVCGDNALSAVARACREVVRPYDLLARYGGEEFVVLLPATSGLLAIEIAERLREAIAEAAFTAGPAVRFATASIGVASHLDGANESFEDLLDRADRAMYVAKRNGKNQVHRAAF